MFFRKHRSRRGRTPAGGDCATAANVLDAYVMHPPSPQHAVDLFRDEWSSQFPAELGLKAGKAPLFEDARIAWFEECVGGFEGRSVLELGPLEAGHTTMLERGGAASIVAVEANTRAYLKCLIVKEICGLRARFLLGDANAFMEQSHERFDLCLASGILYHQEDPARTLERISERGDTVLLWTHYYDEDTIRNNPEIARLFRGSPKQTRFRDLTLEYHPRDYAEALTWGGFCGGPAAHAHWMTKPDILRLLECLGYTRLEIGFDTLEHPNGPSLAIVAQRSPGNCVSP